MKCHLNKKGSANACDVSQTRKDKSLAGMKIINDYLNTIAETVAVDLNVNSLSFWLGYLGNYKHHRSWWFNTLVPAQNSGNFTDDFSNVFSWKQ